MNEIKATGAILSSPDYRDQIAAAGILASTIAEIEAGIAALPEIFKTLLDKFKVLDQNKTPACVSHAWALCMMYWWYKKTGEIVEFSPRFLDILSSEDWIPIDGGRVPRTVCKISANIGCCTTAMLPNDTETRPGESDLDVIKRYRGATITQAMRDEAAKYKIPGYVYIADDSAIDFRLGVKLYGLVSGLFRISDRFWVPSWSPADIMPLKPATPTSGHQMVVYGWEGALNWLRNSWSSLWGYSGDGTYDPKLWLNNIYEGWAIADVTVDLKALLSSLPRPADFHYQWNTNLRRGDYNDDVKFAQIALMILGIMGNVAPEDLGHYGPKTSAAVAKYQAILKIPLADRNPDSIGPLTRGGLNKQFAL